MEKDVIFSKQNPEHSLGFVFWQTTLLWQRTIGDALNQLDLTHVQFVLLAGIGWLTSHYTDVTQTMLSKHAKTDIMMTSKVLRTIEKKGLIKRSSHSMDSRANALEMTEKGCEVLQKSLNIVEEVDQNFFSILGKSQLTFHSNLQKIMNFYNNH